MHRTIERHGLWYRLVWRLERAIKEFLFRYEECGQCILKHNGFVCPMRCPKKLRNGPCGGVRADGSCEVYPDLQCVWAKGIDRSVRYRFLLQDRVPRLWQKTGLFLKSQAKIQPPVDWRMHGTSSWINHAVKKNDRFLSLSDVEGLEAYVWHLENEEVDA